MQVGWGTTHVLYHLDTVRQALNAAIKYPPNVRSVGLQQAMLALFRTASCVQAAEEAIANELERIRPHVFACGSAACKASFGTMRDLTTRGPCHWGDLRDARPSPRIAGLIIKAAVVTGSGLQVLLDANQDGGVDAVVAVFNMLGLV